MKYPQSKQSLIAVAVAASVWAGSAIAEQALEEVIVTARKRDENLQQVPTAINVLTANALEDRQVANIVDLQRTSPNITMTETGGSQAGGLQVFMRGIGNDNGFDPGIGIYIDDVFVQRTQGSMLDLYDVERIEVLKGPQGNLYGRNTIGGAIKYITREPDENFAANVEGKVGSYRLRQLKASVSGPLVEDTLYGGLGFLSRKRDGIQTNRYNGEKLWDADMYGLRGNLKFTPTDTVTVKLGVDYSHDNSAPRIPHLVAADQDTLTTNYFLALITGNLPPTAPPPDFSGIDDSPDRVNSEANYDPYRLQTLTGYLSVQWDINDQWSFKSVTSDRRTDQTFVGEFDGSALVYLSNLQFVETDDLSQEFQANYSGDDLEAVVGVYYTDTEQQTPSVGLITPYVFVNEYRYTDTYKAETLLKSWSVYGNVDYTFLDDWHLSLGARFTHDKKTFEQLSDVTFTHAGGSNTLPPPFPPITLPTHASGPDNFGPESKTWSKFSPSAKLAYDFTEDTMGYISFATGFKAGGFNSYPNGSPSKTYNPEEVKTYALGLKTTLADGRLRINTEAFFNDYSEKQLQYLANVGGNITTLFTNAGKVKTHGVETEISWLTPIEGLQFDINIGFLEAEIKKFERLGLGDVSDDSELGFSPRWTIQPRLSYATTLGEVGDILFAVDASYRAKSYTNSPVNAADPVDSQQVQPEHTIYNAAIVLNTADGHWRFALEGKNLSDKRVLTNTFNLNLGLNQDPTRTSTYVLGSYNDPRTVALSAAYKY